MSQEMLNIIQAIVGGISTMVAVIAIIIALRSEKRSQARFEKQLKREKIIAEANVKPLLTVRSSKYVDYKSIDIVNHGVGTAIITEIVFRKDDLVESKLVVSLFDFVDDFAWDTFRIFGSRNHYVRAGEEIKVITLSLDSLVRQELEHQKSLMILRSFQEQWEGVEVSIEYEDLFGNKQETYTRTLTN